MLYRQSLLATANGKKYSLQNSEWQGKVIINCQGWGQHHSGLPGDCTNQAYGKPAGINSIYFKIISSSQSFESAEFGKHTPLLSGCEYMVRAQTTWSRQGTN